MKKILLYALAGLLLIVVIALAVTVYYVNDIAKEGIQRGGTMVLGVDTTVDGVDVKLLSGNLGMENLRISNPERYDSPHMMKMDDIGLGVETSSLFDEIVHVRQFELEGVDIHIEKKGLKGSNIEEVMANIEKFAKTDQPEPKDPEAGGKKVRIDQVRIRKVTATFHLPSLNEGKTVSQSATIDELVLDDLASDDPATVRKVIARLVPALLAAVMNEAKGKIDAKYLEDLQESIADAAAQLGQNASKFVSQVGGDIAEKVQTELDSVIKKTGAGVDKTIDKLLGNGEKDQSTTQDAEDEDEDEDGEKSPADILERL
ncbi:MAG: AsmA family protein [Phycisphaerae bacterium]